MGIAPQAIKDLSSTVLRIILFIRAKISGKEETGKLLDVETYKPLGSYL